LANHVHDSSDLAQLEREVVVKEIITQIPLRCMSSRGYIDGWYVLLWIEIKGMKQIKIPGLQQDDDLKKTWEVSPFKNTIEEISTFCYQIVCYISKGTVFCNHIQKDIWHSN